MPKCGAKTRNGGKCKLSPVNGKKRCKLHGGKSTGPINQRGNSNGAKPGSLYSRYLSADEASICAELELGSVDEELRLTRIRLMRALKLEAESEECRLELEAETVKPAILGGMPIYDEEPVREKQYKRRDYSALIDRLTARIESLESRRSSLISADLDARLKRIEIDRAEREADNNNRNEPVVGIDIRVIGSNGQAR